MLWIIIVLIPKGNEEYQEIGLLEPFWKLMECIIDGKLGAIEIHDCLHVFQAGRRTRTTMIKIKLAQQLAFLEKVLLFGTFVDLWKAYDTLNCK